MSLFPDPPLPTARRICGIDEAGRGPLAGPVIASAVVLDPNNQIAGITDSKKLSPSSRYCLAQEIRDRALAWAIGKAEVVEIDTLNILQATLLAMSRAFDQIQVPLELAMVDGNQAPRINCPTQTVVRGDAKVEAIGAASILAKVERDRVMIEYAKQHPEYGFDVNFGYYSAEHIDALKTYGPSPIHRKSFRPVAEALQVNSQPPDLFDQH
ncbi:MAG: ribonuclease HII [Gammaproteobacteria bacterium]|nr:ribonuclease HII [Gammaproteobacteria bacterium]MYF03405.1 ribonuclease HII [Gammaproteobacteria bacterium]MYI76743.1 ribonuclease HII [Gammaproteobacteria bacterium]